MDHLRAGVFSVPLWVMVGVAAFWAPPLGAETCPNIDPTTATHYSAIPNEPFQLEFHSAYPKPPVNPFDFNRYLEVTLYSPNCEKSLMVHGYWDGNDSWNARVSLNLSIPAQTQVQWKFVTRFVGYPDSGLDGQVGVIDLKPCAESNISGINCNLETVKHGGILKMDATGKRFAYQDGSAFDWIADTWWFFPRHFKDAVTPTANNPTGNFLGTALAKRKDQKFTVIQSHGLDKMLYDYFGAAGDDASRLAAFQQTGSTGQLSGGTMWADFDAQVKQVNRAGLVLFLGFGIYAQLGKNPFLLSNVTSTARVDIQRLFVYLLDRYGAYNINFLVTQEYNQYFDAPNSAYASKCTEGAKLEYLAGSGSNEKVCVYSPSFESRVSLVDKIGQTIHDRDPYKRALTVHNSVSTHDILEGQIPADPNAVPPAWGWSWVSFLMLQRGHFINHNQPTEYTKLNYPKPFVEGEINYEGFGRIMPNGVYLDLKAPLVAESLAVAKQSGALGISYGANALYVSVADLSEYTEGMKSWGPPTVMSDALELPGAALVQWVSRAFLGLDPQLLQPLSGRMAYSNLNYDICALNRCRMTVTGYREPAPANSTVLRREHYAVVLQRSLNPYPSTFLKVESPSSSYRVRGFRVDQAQLWMEKVVTPQWIPAELAPPQTNPRIGRIEGGWYLFIPNTPALAPNETERSWIIRVDTES